MDGIDLVKATASKEYLEYGAFEDAIFQSPVEIEKLVGAGLGLAGEVGEFNEILKKHIFQEKTFDIDHAKKELGDIYWYFCLACIGLGTDPTEIEQIVVEKLTARYNGGRFSKELAENRKPNDL